MTNMFTEENKENRAVVLTSRQRYSDQPAGGVRLPYLKGMGDRRTF